jgi:glutamyl-tRNA(Gln) amidotransferase subunit D
LTEEFSGYRGEALRSLKEIGAKIGDIIRITKDEIVYEGSLIPRSEYSDDKQVVIKLKSGYNIGIHISSITRIKKIGAGIKPAFVSPPSPEQKPDLPSVTIVSTGGTIASRVDYRTGGVRPALSANDLYSIVPELSEIAKIKAEILLSLFSENITPKHWSEIAKVVSSHIKKSVTGVVVAHGTDSLAYTAAALSFALQNLPVPVIMVGSQRSADRPSSDAAINLTSAVMAAAKAPFAEVVIAMHEDISDNSIVFHRGTKVRKCHTSRRDAFKSINTFPLARIKGKQITMLADNYKERDQTRKIDLKSDFDEKVALVKFYPGLDPKVIDWYINEDYRGIVLEGTGLGHIGNYCFSAIQRAIENDVVVTMTSQCIWGRVNMNVYDTGRDLLTLGVIPLEDTLPETALVKLMWILGSLKPSDIDEARRFMLTNFTGEMNPRSSVI